MSIYVIYLYIHIKVLKMLVCLSACSHQLKLWLFLVSTIRRKRQGNDSSKVSYIRLICQIMLYA